MNNEYENNDKLDNKATKPTRRHSISVNYRDILTYFRVTFKPALNRSDPQGIQTALYDVLAKLRPC